MLSMLLRLSRVLQIANDDAHAGTVTNVREASLWLSYTYLFVRMLRNPLAYGVGWEELTADPRLEGRRSAFTLHGLSGFRV